MCVLLIALETRTARRFCDLCGILRRSCVEKYEKWEKCPLVLFVKPSNKGFIIPLLFHSFDFQIYRTALSVHHIDCIRSTRMTKQHERNHLSVLCDQLKTLSRVKVLLYKSSLTNARKKKSTCVALYFCPVLQYNTIYYRGIFFAGPLEFIWFIDAVME